MVTLIRQKLPAVKARGLIASAFLLSASLAACSGPQVTPVAVEPPPAIALPTLPTEPAMVYPRKVASFTQTGLASWYGASFKRKHTASGERFDMTDLTAAHRSLPLGTVVLVTNLNNGRSVRLRVNDRGPFTPGRVIDVSHEAATVLDMKKSGVVPVRIEVFDSDQRLKVAEYPVLY